VEIVEIVVDVLVAGLETVGAMIAKPVRSR